MAYVIIDETYKMLVFYSQTCFHIISWPQIETYVKISPGPPADEHRCMETRTVKLPKALTNMSRMMMPAFVDVVEIYLDH